MKVQFNNDYFPLTIIINTTLTPSSMVCDDMVFKIPSNYGQLVLLLNIIFPGLGTCLTACLGDDKFVFKAILLGIL